jgi:hypothetical protein
MITKVTYVLRNSIRALIRTQLIRRAGRVVRHIRIRGVCTRGLSRSEA